MKIKSININAFRGIPSLDLELAGKNLILRGENGTGKSSLIDAIEFFFTGKVTHLEGVQGLSLIKHGPHVNHEKKDVKVTLTFNPGNATLARDFSKPPVPNPPLKEYFEVTEKGTFILRRIQILSFIMSKPVDRFRAIGSIIGIDPLDDLELEMMRARDDLKGSFQSKREQMDALLVLLSEILESEITDIDQILSPLNNRLLEFEFGKVTSLDKLNDLSSEMLKSSGLKNFQSKNSLQKIIEDLRDLHISQDTVDLFHDLDKRVAEILKNEESKMAKIMMEMLRVGEEIITHGESGTCPLCEQPIERDKVLVRIKQRIATMTGLSDEASKIRTESISIINALEQIKSYCERTIEDAKPFHELLIKTNKLKEKLGEIESYKVIVEKARKLEDHMQVEIFDNLCSQINEIAKSMADSVQKISENLSLSGNEQKILSVFRLIEKVKMKTDEFHNLKNENKKLKNFLNVAETVYSSFMEAKKSKVQEVYDSIQLDVKDFYSFLHPQETVTNLSLQVAAGRRASTDIKIESFGRLEDPRAFTSEGHLDSLGLCIFLAFTKEFNKGCPLIILDDVVTTIDAGHRSKISGLLMEKFSENQLIITTHDEIWYEQLRSNQRRYGRENEFLNLVINRWDVNYGPSIKQHKPRWDTITEYLKEGAKEPAGNEGRRYLEFILDTICNTTRALVPYNKLGKLEIGDMYNSAQNRVNSLLKDGDYKNGILSAFSKIDSTLFMGNILSHNNPLSNSLSITEVESFCENVNELYEKFSCPTCHHSVEYNQRSHIIQCSNARCETPLRERTN